MEDKRVSELEDNRKFTSWRTERKKLNKNEQRLKDIWDSVKLFEELVAEKSLNLVKNVNLHIQEIEWNYRTGNLSRKSCLSTS